MKKILHILGSLNQGGAETYLLRYLQYDRENEHYVLCKYGITGPLEKEYKKVAHIITDINFSHILGDYHKFYRFLKDQHIDSVWDGTTDITLIIAKFAGVKNRYLFYRSSSSCWVKDSFYIRHLYNFILRKLCSLSVTKILANSETALKRFHPNYKKHPERFQVIYNGISTNSISNKNRTEIRELLHIPKDAFIVGHSGRLDPAKNHPMIIDVAISLCKKYEDIHFVLMGLNVDKKYGEQIEQLGLENRIHLLGYRKDVMDILKGLDLYYFPSVTEGQPNALIEALVSGLPFVASNIDPIKEATPTLLHKNLVDPRDKELNVSAIENFYLNRDRLSSETCAEWAINYFEANRQFHLFKTELER